MKIQIKCQDNNCEYNQSGYCSLGNPELLAEDINGYYYCKSKVTVDKNNKNQLKLNIT